MAAEREDQTPMEYVPARWFHEHMQYQRAMASEHQRRRVWQVCLLGVISGASVVTAVVVVLLLFGVQC